MPRYSKKQKDIVLEVYSDFNNGFSFLKKTNNYLQIPKDGNVENASPIEYWNHGRKVFNSLVSTTNRRRTEKWMSTYSTGLGRNKILALVAHVVSQYISPNITAQNLKQLEDKVASMFAGDMVEHSLDKEHFEVTQFWSTITAMAEGMCVIEENYIDLKRKVKDIEDYNYDDDKVEYTEKERQIYKGAKFSIVPNDHFIPSNPYARDINENDWIITYYRNTKQNLGQYFGHYKNWSKVLAGTKTWVDETNDAFKTFSDQVPLAENEVVVIKRYNLVKDTLDIVANGVCLTQPDNPIPRPADKKKYPFAILLAEPIDADFYMGKSISDRLLREQDAVDLAYRMFFDRELLNTFPPLETDDEDLLNEDLLRPRVLMAKAHGKEGTKPMIQPQSTAGLQNLIQKLEQNAQENSISNAQTGQLQEGANPTATQTLQMAKSAQIILNLFNEMQRYWMTALTELRLETLLWRLDKDEASEITVHAKKLNSGKKGTRAYFLDKALGSKTDKEKRDLSVELLKLEEKMKGKMEAVAINPNDLIKNMDYYIRCDAEPSPRRTSDLEKMMAQSKFQLYAQYPQVFDILDSARTLAEQMGDDPDETVKEPETPQALPQQGMGEKPPQPQVQNPEPTMKQAMGLTPPN